MIKPHKEKYDSMYWAIAEAAASQSIATRRKVGALIVTPTGMLSIGWNGMPSGFDNWPEEPAYDEGIYIGELTKPEVIHAERNAIDKMTRQGVPIEGSILFTTTAPCLECAKSIHGLGLAHVFYRDLYSCSKGLDFLTQAGIPHSHSF